MSKPRPVKPNSSAVRTVAGPPITEIMHNRDGSVLWTNTFDSTPDNYDYYRTFATGYPLMSIGPNLFFKRPTGYYARSFDRVSLAGDEVFRFDDGLIADEYHGGSQRQHIAPGTKFWAGEDLAGIPTNYYNRLSTELMLKVGSKKASIGQSLAESREAIHMLFETSLTLFKAYKAAKKGNFKQVFKALGISRRNLRSKTIAGKWLELQFGWLPLMSDIHDTFNLVRQGFREKTHLASNIRKLTDSDNQEYIDGNYSVKSTGKASYIMKVYYSIDPSHLRQLGEMGCLNPLEIGWELVPFSFVVDWFLPIGNFLDALTAPIGVTFVAGYYSVKAETTSTEISPMNAVAFSHLDICTRAMQTIATGYRRNTLAGFPAPALYWRDPFSSNHLADALALLIQNSRR